MFIEIWIFFENYSPQHFHFFFVYYIILNVEQSEVPYLFSGSEF